MLESGEGATQQTKQFILPRVSRSTDMTMYSLSKTYQSKLLRDAVHGFICRRYTLCLAINVIVVTDWHMQRIHHHHQRTAAVVDESICTLPVHTGNRFSISRSTGINNISHELQNICYDEANILLRIQKGAHSALFTCLRAPSTHNRLTALCPGLPGWAGTRRNTHPRVPILAIKHPLPTSSI